MLSRIFALTLLLLAFTGLSNAFPGESTVTAITITAAPSGTGIVIPVPGLYTTYTLPPAIIYPSGFSVPPSLLTDSTSASLTSPPTWLTSGSATQPTTGLTISTSQVSVTGSSSLTTTTSVVTAPPTSTTLKGSSSTTTSSASTSSTSTGASAKLKIPAMFVFFGHVLSSFSAPRPARQVSAAPMPVPCSGTTNPTLICLVGGSSTVTFGQSTNTVPPATSTTPQPTLLTTSTMSESTTSAAPTSSPSKGASANLKVPTIFLLVSHLLSSVNGFAPNIVRQSYPSTTPAPCSDNTDLFCVVEGGATITLGQHTTSTGYVLLPSSLTQSTGSILPCPSNTAAECLVSGDVTSTLGIWKCPSNPTLACIQQSGSIITVGTLPTSTPMSPTGLPQPAQPNSSNSQTTSPMSTSQTTSLVSTKTGTSSIQVVSSTTSSSPTSSPSTGVSASLKVPAVFFLISRFIASVKGLAPNAVRQDYVTLSAAQCSGSPELFCLTQGASTSTLNSWHCPSNTSLAHAFVAGTVLTVGTYPPTTALSPTGMPQPAQPNTTSSTIPTTSLISTSQTASLMSTSQTNSHMSTTTGASSTHTVSSTIVSSTTSTSTSKAVAPTMVVALGGGSLTAVAIAAFMAL